LRTPQIDADAKFRVRTVISVCDENNFRLTMASEIVEAFDRLRHDQPDRKLIYLPARGEAWSTVDIWECTMRIRQTLRTANVSNDALVLSAIGNHPAAFAVLLACRAESLPLLPVDGGTSSQEIASIAGEFGARVAILPAGRTLAGFADPIPIEPALAILASSRQPSPRSHRGAILKLTSGSTGLPRAAAAAESALVSDGTLLAAAMDITPYDVQIAAIPLSHSYALGNLVMPLLLHGTAIVLRDGFVPQRIAEDAHAFQARHLPGVPYMFEHFVTHPPIGGWPSPLTRLISAGALLKAETAERFRQAFAVKIRAFYGTSETGGIAFDDSDDTAGEGMVGLPLPGVTVTLRRDLATEARVGRVHVRSRSVALGYTDGDEASGFCDGGFLTGDVGYIDDAGELTLTGRVSTFVNVAGRKVQTEEVERALREFAGLIDVRVFGVTDAKRGEQLVACVAFADGPRSVVELRQFCATRLAAHKIPRVFVFVAEIPLSDRGKTDRAHMERLARAEIARAGAL
jgi:long-chain acyl-CoA synthetase